MYSDPTRSTPTIWSTPKSCPPAPGTPGEKDPTPEPVLTTIGFVDSIRLPMIPFLVSLFPIIYDWPLLRGPTFIVPVVPASDATPAGRLIVTNVLSSVAIREKKLMWSPPTCNDPVLNLFPKADSPLLTSAPPWLLLLAMNLAETYISSSASIIKPCCVRICSWLFGWAKRYPNWSFWLSPKLALSVQGTAFDTVPVAKSLPSPLLIVKLTAFSLGVDMWNHCSLGALSEPALLANVELSGGI